MDETTQAGEMPEQHEQHEQTAAQTAAEMVTISASELAEIRAALKRANGEAAKHRKAQEQLEADQRAKQEAEMTELQRLEARAKAAEERAAQLERATLQREIAAKVGLPAALATRLIGSTAEEMEADAAALLETLPKQPKPTPGIVATNPGANGSAAETREAKKARLMGTPGDIWAGGGILHPEG